jgi:hypothetical protein
MAKIPACEGSIDGLGELPERVMRGNEEVAAGGLIEDQIPTRQEFDTDRVPTARHRTRRPLWDDHPLEFLPHGVRDASVSSFDQPNDLFEPLAVILVAGHQTQRVSNSARGTCDCLMMDWSVPMRTSG